MAKPASLPRWGDISGVIVEPNSAKKDIGFVSGEEPSAEYLMWLLNLSYQWHAYVEAGEFEDTTTIPAGATLDVDGTADLRDCFLQLPVRRKAIDISSGQQSTGVAGSATYSGSAVVYTAVAGYDCQIALHEGDGIQTIKAGYSRDGATNLVFSLFERTLAGVETSLADVTISAGTGDATTTFAAPTAGSLPQVFAGDKTYFLRMTGGAGDSLYGWIVGYGRE